MTTVQGRRKREQAALDFIAAQIRDQGYAPSVRELADHLDSSLDTTHRLLNRLEENGHIRRSPNVARSICLLPLGEQAAS